MEILNPLKKKIFFVGAMGSGKTEIAVNYAAYMAKQTGLRTGLVDLDMIKPYFRLRNIIEELNDSNVEPVIPEDKTRYVDFPVISPRMESYILDPARPAVIDVGGDEIGARLVGRYANRLDPSIVEFFYVYNSCRPLSLGLDDVDEIMSSIERASGFSITGIVHNSHLLSETTVDLVCERVHTSLSVANKRSLDVRFHCIREDMFEEASKRLKGFLLFPLKLFFVPIWIAKNEKGISKGGF